MQLLTFVVTFTLPYFVFSKPNLVSVIENACKPEKDYKDQSEISYRKNIAENQEDGLIVASAFEGAKHAYEGCVQAMKMLMNIQIEDRKNRPWRKGGLPLEMVINQNCFSQSTTKQLFDCLRYVSQ
ncbi:hypothetical protein TcasGA2_TC033370 [Tribolium castaneum]|uniref:Uncharacterized protein n=1 Tax=Tribolium castaneum TaxID=7070 RepID=A0A139WGE9_TRICA|nr:PREDICTED: uncharacterized protein LOC107398062 [Tribolium castaneum]KYB27043.1 hypothetical protein TcasGA2_TC033370 [Tribolium castaneum]|eukprot:XP_015836310.1 PREDICTED: uncharacterized protein LOC107398062 [Tribolium castaneum]